MSNSFHLENLSNLMIKTVKCLINRSNDNRWLVLFWRLRSPQRNGSHRSWWKYWLFRRWRTNNIFGNRNGLKLSDNSFDIPPFIRTIVVVEILIISFFQIPIPCHHISHYLVLHLFVNLLQMLINWKLLLSTYFDLGNLISLTQTISIHLRKQIQIISKEWHQKTVYLYIRLIVLDLPRQCPFLPCARSFKLPHHHYYKIISQINHLKSIH